MLLARVHGEHALAPGTPVSVAAHGPVTALPAPATQADGPSAPLA